MSYENPQLPDGMNVGAHRPFLDFVFQGGIALALLAVLVWGLFQVGSLLGPLVPFEWEKRASTLAQQAGALTPQTPEAKSRSEVLQRLVDELTPHLDMPEGMDITIHYAPGSEVNAFATLGGNVVIYDGLIQRLPSENALSMVVAHEIGHVKHRDVMRGLGGQMMLMLIVGLATGDSGLAAEVVNNIEMLTTLQHSRGAEEWADKEGVTALNGNYGHINGYHQTFDALTDWMADVGADQSQPPEFLRTHPDIATRIRKIAAFAARMGWKTEGTLTPLRQANFPKGTVRPAWTVNEDGAGGETSSQPEWIPSPKRKSFDNPVLRELQRKRFDEIVSDSAH